MKYKQLINSIHRNNAAYLLTLSLLAASFVAVSEEVSELNKINVSATRTAQTVDETLSAVSVITRDEIETSQAHDLTELLDGLPGVIMSNNGGLGKNSSVIMRGTTSKHVLVLIDGMPIGSATLGTTSLQHIPLSQIDRVEVVRGPRSQLYGSAALGGIIQIFTRKGDKEPRFSAEASYGSHKTVTGEVGFASSSNGTDLGLNISQVDTEGFDSLKNNNPDKDGYDNRSISAQLGHRYNDKLKLNINVLSATGNTEYDSAWGPTDSYDSDFTQQSVNGGLEYMANDWWDINLSLGKSKDKTVNHSNGIYVSNFTTDRQQLSLQNDLMLDDDNVLTVGLDLQTDKVEGSSTYSINERDNTGIFIQHQTILGANDLVVGLRRDDNDSFDAFNTGSISWGRDVSDELRLIASYGTAFKTPTFNDLYYQDPWGSNGNPNILPEESQSIELGLQGKQAWGQWDLRVYEADIEKLIAWVEVSPFVYQPQNVDGANIKGAELALSTRFSDWDVAGSLTVIDPRDTTTDKILIERSKSSLRLSMDRSFGNTGVGATFQARSRSYSNTGNTLFASGFGTLDLRVSHALSKQFRLGGKVRNLLDKEYETIRTYNTGGREYFMTVSYHTK